MGQSAVVGLDEFRRHMAGLEGSYAIIGGTACDILLSDADLPFRATHDLDTVLVADARLPQTAKAIWELIHDGGYRCGWGGEQRACFYRFTDPTQPGYPFMIELFSKEPNFLAGTTGIEVGPLHVSDDVSSLSAILLNEEYYRVMLGGIKTVDGLSVLAETHLIPFKAKAYLDLSERRQRGEQIDSKKIKKHKRDVLRLAQLLGGNERVALPQSVQNDMAAFLEDCKGDRAANLKQIGIHGVSLDDLLNTMNDVYGIQPHGKTGQRYP